MRVACARHGDAHAGDRCTRCSPRTRSVRRRASASTFSPIRTAARRVATLAEVQPGDQVLEIGPGLGSLTLALLERGARVVALELDASLARILESVLDAAVGPDVRPVDVRVGDACTVDLSALLAGSAGVVVRLQPSVQRRGARGRAAARGSPAGRPASW